MGLFSKIFRSKNKQSSSGITTRINEPDVYSFSGEDEKMTWAIEKARLTLHYFISRLSEPNNGQIYFSVKVKIDGDDKTEHIWLIDPDIDGEGNLFGTVSNNPLQVNTVKINQRIGVKESLITDWFIVENGKMIGGYTIRTIREKLSGNDLSEFDHELGGTIKDYGEDHFIADFSTPEGAIICIEQAYTDKDIERAIACKDFDAEALLMANDQGIKDPPTIDEISKLLRLTFIRYLQEEGFPDFSNIKRAFIEREKITDEHWIITEVIYYPDGTNSMQRMNMYLTENGWRVMGPEN